MEETKSPAKMRFISVKGIDLAFVFLIVVLTLVGIIVMFSASFVEVKKGAAYYFLRQGGFAAAGVALMLIISSIDYHIYKKFAFPALLISLGLLAAVLAFGRDLNTDAKRWLGWGSFTFQPSEIAKVGVIIYFAAKADAFKEKMLKFKYGIGFFIGVLGIVTVLLALEPHLSATVLIWVAALVVMFAGGANWKLFLGALLGGGGLVAAMTVKIVRTGTLFVTGVKQLDSIIARVESRVAVWIDPFADPADKGYQAIQSLYALGSGGWLGVGLGESRQKYSHLPEQFNDFIFAVAGEELGFIGACVIMAVFMIFIARGYMIAYYCRDRFGTLLATGIMTLIATQTIFNIMVVSTLLPTTGISLPFFSYGGTALMIQLMEMGIVLSVSKNVR